MIALPSKIVTFLSFYLAICAADGNPEALRNRYRPQSGVRCTGGTSYTIGTVQDSVIKCSKMCDSRRDCVGFNWASANGGACLALTVGCKMGRDESSVFFMRKPQRSKGVVTAKQIVSHEQYKQLANTFLNYNLRVGQRCVGEAVTKLSKKLYELQECKAICDSRNDCLGFNWRSPKGICVVRRKGCNMVADPASVFFRKREGTEWRTTTQAPRHLHSVWPVSDVEGEWRRSYLFPDYQVARHKTCLGNKASLIGEAQTDTKDCQDLCDRHPDCYGFTWHPSVRNCVTRTFDCTVSKDVHGALLYRKAPKKREFPENSTELRNGQRYVEGFEALTKTKCFGGYSVPLGDIESDRDICAYICQTDPICAGFNLKASDGMCALRTFGCTRTRSGLFTYYKRNDRYPTLPRLTLTTQNETQILTTTPRASSLRNFYIKENTRCAGGSSYALQFTHGLDECVEACSAIEECYGFNYQQNGDCTLRTAGCREEDDSTGMAYYGKARQEI